MKTNFILGKVKIDWIFELGQQTDGFQMKRLFSNILAVANNAVVSLKTTQVDMSKRSFGKLVGM